MHAREDQISRATDMNDSQALRDFVGIDLSRESVPDATTLLMRAGTIVDATSIAAPSLTKNADDTRDPEMHQTKKAKNTAQLFGLANLVIARRSLLETPRPRCVLNAESGLERGQNADREGSKS
jgi:hypothetical protein